MRAAGGLVFASANREKRPSPEDFHTRIFLTVKSHFSASKRTSKLGENQIRVATRMRSCIRNRAGL